MTDKQIIIDGVDVSGCEKQGETIAGITCGNGERIRLANEIITKHKLCKDNPNCVYKQLKRKEQELEELQETIDDFITDNKSLYSYDGREPSNLDELQECMQSSMNVFVKYKQIISDIKEIAEVEIECKTYEIENDCFNETRCKALNEHIDFIKQIL